MSTTELQQQLAEQAAQRQQQTCEAQLRDHWGLSFEKNLHRAVRAYEETTGQPAETAPRHIANDTRTIEALARMPDETQREAADLVQQMMQPGLTYAQKDALMLKHRMLYERKYRG